MTMLLLVFGDSNQQSEVSNLSVGVMDESVFYGVHLSDLVSKFLHRVLLTCRTSY